MTTDATGAAIGVQVVYAIPGRAWISALRLPEGSTAGQAVAIALENELHGLPLAGAALAIYGQAITAGTVLRDGDRLEVLRPLEADPKLRRRSRARENVSGRK